MAADNQRQAVGCFLALGQRHASHQRTQVLNNLQSVVAAHSVDRGRAFRSRRAFFIAAGITSLLVDYFRVFYQIVLVVGRAALQFLLQSIQSVRLGFRCRSGSRGRVCQASKSVLDSFQSSIQFGVNCRFGLRSRSWCRCRSRSRCGVVQELGSAHDFLRGRAILDERREHTFH